MKYIYEVYIYKWVDVKRCGYEDERYTIFSRVPIQLPRISSLAIL